MRNVSAADLTVTPEGSTTPLAGTLVCKNTQLVVVSCAAGPVTWALFTPSALLVAGQTYHLHVNDQSGVTPATGLAGVAMILLIGMLFGVGLTAISMAMAFSVRSHGDFFSVLGFLSLPMIFLSSALVPLAAMPAWMGVLAKFNPMTWAIDAVRPLILQGWAEALPHVGMVIVVMLIFDALCLYGGARAFRRAIG